MCLESFISRIEKKKNYSTLNYVLKYLDSSYKKARYVTKN